MPRVVNVSGVRGNKNKKHVPTPRRRDDVPTCPLPTCAHVPTCRPRPRAQQCPGAQCPRPTSHVPRPTCHVPRANSYITALRCSLAWRDRVMVSASLSLKMSNIDEYRVCSVSCTWMVAGDKRKRVLRDETGELEQQQVRSGVLYPLASDPFPPTEIITSVPIIGIDTCSRHFDLFARRCVTSPYFQPCLEMPRGPVCWPPPCAAVPFEGFFYNLSIRCIEVCATFSARGRWIGLF